MNHKFSIEVLNILDIEQGGNIKKNIRNKTVIFR